MAASEVMRREQYCSFQDEDHLDGESFESSQEKPQFLESFKVLDPDDPLMQRFQNAFNSHLKKINEMLSEESKELTVAYKQAEQKRLQGGNIMYEVQHEITNQVTLIEKWKTSYETIKCWREEEKKNIDDMKNAYNIIQHEYNTQLQTAESMNRDIESLLSMSKRLAEYETEVSNHLAIARRMSEKDACIQRELIRKKQQMDFTLLRISETAWKLEQQLDILQKQIQIKTAEKMAISQTITDVDTDFGILEREQKKLINSWQRVIFNIQQRDKAYEELSTQRMNIQESLKNTQRRIESLKKNMMKTMKYNEQLSEVEWKINDELSNNEGAINMHVNKYQVVQYKTDSLMKLVENTEAQFTAATSKHQRLTNEENATGRELEKLTLRRNVLEEEVMGKLEDKMAQNKTLKRFNELLRNTKEALKQFELTMLQVENHYAKCLLEIAHLSRVISTDNIDLMEFDNMNNSKNNELNRLQNEITQCDMIIEKKQKKIAELNEKINQMNSNVSGNMMSMLRPHEIKILSLEKDIEKFEIDNKEKQRYWLRQEAMIVDLTEQNNSATQDINRLNKQIIIIQQKKLKLECASDKEHKTERNIERRMNELHQRLLNTNTLLAEQREMRHQLRDKNSIVKDEYMNILQQNEREFINQQNKIEDLINEKSILIEKLRYENHNYLSWNNKMEIAIETAKQIKVEQNPGGNVAIMRSEIRRMEMRLLYLRKVQEKMIRDMEYCITRREMIVNTALMKQMKNPKLMHNKRVMFQKRIDGRKLEIKQTKKATASMENEISNVEKQNETLQNTDKESEQILKSHLEEMKELDKQIADCEIMKHHELECLVRKQRKIKLFQSVNDGKYKTICKSVAILDDELHHQKTLNNDLIDIMEQTNQDFPLFNNDVKQILLTLQPID